MAYQWGEGQEGGRMETEAPKGLLDYTLLPFLQGQQQKQQEETDLTNKMAGAAMATGRLSPTPKGQEGNMPGMPGYTMASKANPEITALIKEGQLKPIFDGDGNYTGVTPASDMEKVLANSSIMDLLMVQMAQEFSGDDTTDILAGGKMEMLEKLINKIKGGNTGSGGNANKRAQAINIIKQKGYKVTEELIKDVLRTL